MLFTVAMIVAKFLIWFLRFFGSGGTTLPGRVAAKIFPGILPALAKSVDVILITGTNGKTTTGRIISRILEVNNIPHLQNRSGANLVTGITTSFIEASGIRGTLSCGTAVIEADEAAFRSVAPLLSPKVIVITNFFRDQLDRFGELFTTVNNVKAGVSGCPDAILVLNADDSLSVSIGNESSNRILYYGADNYPDRMTEDISGLDAAFCIYCREKYEYTVRMYGHLGHFKCPGCGFGRPEPHIACTGIKELSLSGSVVSIRFDRRVDVSDTSDAALLGDETSFSSEKFVASDASGESEASASAEFAVSETFDTSVTEEQEVLINLPGLYNIYNALSAAACGIALGFPEDSIVEALQSFECGFGRMESVEYDGRRIQIILVKNPTGFNQAIKYILNVKGRMAVAFLINDNYADGTDISWLWDVDFEVFMDAQDRIITFYNGGIRAEDMAVRLKYAGIPADRIIIRKDFKSIIKSALSLLSEGETLFILPTYTAMFDVRRILQPKFKLTRFWE